MHSITTLVCIRTHLHTCTMSSRYKKGGCERIVEDAPIIGDSSLIITNEHNKAILETEAF